MKYSHYPGERGSISGHKAHFANGLDTNSDVLSALVHGPAANLTTN
jgi:hypothetical protein